MDYRVSQQNVAEQLHKIITLFLEKIFKNGFFCWTGNGLKCKKRGFTRCRRIFLHWLRAFWTKNGPLFFVFFMNSQKFPKHDGKKEATWKQASFSAFKTITNQSKKTVLKKLFWKKSYENVKKFSENQAPKVDFPWFFMKIEIFFSIFHLTQKLNELYAWYLLCSN